MSQPIDELTLDEKKALLRKRLESKNQLNEHYLPATPAQQALWTFTQLNPDSLAYHLKFTAHVNPAFPPELLEKALAILLSRHCALNSRFLYQNKQLFNVFDPQLHLCFTHSQIMPDEVEERILNDYKKPFLLEQGGLIRAYLYSLETNKQIILLVVHHIILDGVSMLRLIGELGEVINALQHQQANLLEPLSIDYRHYLRYQARFMESTEYLESERYWMNHLHQTSQTLNLPYSHKRERTPEYQGETYALYLNQDKGLALKKMAAQSQVTLYALLMGIYQLLLAAICNDKTILSATPVMGRDREEFLSLLGYFANMVVMKSTIDPSQSVLEFFSSIGNTLFEALQHQNYPFSTLINKLVVDRDLTSLPLVQAAFAFHQPLLSGSRLNIQLHSTDNEQFHWGTSVVTPCRIGPTAFYQFDLYLVAMEERKNEITLSFGYLTDVFDQETIKNIANHYVNLIDSILDDSTCRIEQLPAYAPFEDFKQYILSSYNNTYYPYRKTETSLEPLLKQTGETSQQITKTDRQAGEQDLFDDVSIVQMLLDVFLSRPESIAVIDSNGSYTFHELLLLSFGLAQQLCTLKREPGQAIGILVEKGVYQIISVLATLFSGHYFVPINIDTPSKRLDAILQTAAIDVLLSTAAIASHLSLEDVLILDVSQSLPVFNFHPISSPLASIIYVIFTSGTTGVPKGVVISQQSLLNTVLAINEKFKIGENDRVFALSDLSFDLAMYDVFGTLLAGACLVFPDQEAIREPQQWINAINQHQVTLWNSVPMLFSMLLTQATEPLPLKKVFLSGDWVSVDLVKRGHALCPQAQLVSLGGPTETTIWSIYYLIERDVDYDYIPYGFPLPNHRYYVLDGQGALCRENQSGELYAAGMGLALAYLNNEELTKQAFISHPIYGRLYRCGDLGLMTKQFGIRIRGRNDSQIKIGGYRIELDEVRHALEKSFSGRGVACDVLSLNETKKLIAYIEFPLSDSLEFYSIDEVQNHPVFGQEYRLLEHYLPPYMLPSHFIILNKLPLSSNGKLDKTSLPGFQLEQILPDQDLLTCSFEKRIAEIWKNTLHLKDHPLQRNSHFFALGGQSLNALEMILQVRAELSIEIDLKTIFHYPTLKIFCEQLRLRQFNQLYEAERLVVLRQAKKAAAIIVLVHPGTGTIDCYLGFLAQFAEEFTIVALQFKQSSASNLNELAREYVQELLAAFPDNQVHLLGYSLGAHIAFEMAKIMQENKRPCQDLALVDALPIREGESIYSDYDEQALKSVIIQDFGISEEQLPLYVQYINERKNLLESLCQNYLTEGRLICPVAVFKARNSFLQHSGIERSTYLHWSENSSAPLMQYDCDGTHMTILSESNISSFLLNYNQFLLGR